MTSPSFTWVALAALLALAGGPGAAAGEAPADGGKHPGAREHGGIAVAKRAGAGPPGAATSGAGHGGIGWSYAGKAGPQNWGRLSKEFRLCEGGRMQSPIDIAGGFAATGEAIEFEYRLTRLNIVHNGHTIQVNYEPGSGITVGGVRYALVQFHFHAPSEHAVGHRRAAMEVHFVHRSAEGRLAVVGAMLEAGAENLALREIWANLPARPGAARIKEDVLINARDLLPEDRRYYHYMGSLTTPPCSEGVHWYVLARPLTVSVEQVNRFATAVGSNARPLQALNDRLVLVPAGSVDAHR